MKEPSNPFTMRSSESIEKQQTFLKLFGSGVLDVLPDDCFLNKITIFRSGPGGGKTSLFRLFAPESLREIATHGSENKDLLNSLQKFQVISNKGPELLGVYLRLSDYASFQDLNVDEDTKNKYLFSLIGYRLILKLLNGILILKNLDHDQLHRIKIGKPVGEHNLANSPLPCTGKELYEWSSKMEQKICGIINRFDILQDTSILMYDNIEHIYSMVAKNIFLDDQPIVQNVLIMLDDLHELRKTQRANLLKKITPTRFPIPIWIAERLEALELDELIPGFRGREYNTVYLEEHWESSRGKTFETFVKSISIKRAQLANLDFEINSIHEHLEGSIDLSEWNSKFQDISMELKNRLHKLSHIKSTYDDWIANQEEKIQTPIDNMIDWEILNIKIAREEKNAQKKLFDYPLESEDEDDSGLKAAAEFFIHDEFKVPYFFGFSKIAKLATFNVEQFLEIASELFDEIVSQKIKNKKNDILLAHRQEEIIKKIAKTHWEQIPKRNRNGREIINFLTSFKEFARSQTMQPNAPYPPGVTGVGISKKFYEQIIDPEIQKTNKNFKHLAEILQSCISHNYLKAKYEARQGKQGSEVTILYLNRLFCANFNLPLGRGGWRYKNPDELCEWSGMELKPTKKRRV